MERKNSFVLCLCLILLGAICLTSFGVSAEHDSLLKVNKTQTNSSTTAANAASSSAASTKISAKGKAKTKTEAKKKNIGDMFRKVNTLIRRAIEEGNLPEFQKLWTSALKPEEINHVHKDGATPLLLTIEHGQREMFESVMQSKPDLNLAHGTTGDTPLVAAIMKKDALMATSLIHNNADVNLGNSVTGLMPLGAVISSKENAAVLINPLIKKVCSYVIVLSVYEWQGSACS